ncbi:hypothetical protein PK28_17370 (plasmid) [Hymenobacter sp. DG25B]|uniref:hypothetical protein n=1 Tax=Hymenobacter sp. DG25B TaxID=1385664 RepID=UPI000540A31D|nr:hypothetical protein [Hymenobacter sp. DG25B]AIZ65434.1 hypothetical protein PK28_17370 [Hymenobacter sp. DG25B]
MPDYLKAGYVEAVAVLYAIGIISFYVASFLQGLYTKQAYFSKHRRVLFLLHVLTTGAILLFFYGRMEFKLIVAVSLALTGVFLLASSGLDKVR